jgi:hypothetical protein
MYVVERRRYPKELLVGLLTVNPAKYREGQCGVVSARFLLARISQVRCLILQYKGKCVMSVVSVTTLDVNEHTSIRRPE